MWREEAVAVVKLREDGVGPTHQRAEWNVLFHSDGSHSLPMRDIFAIKGCRFFVVFFDNIHVVLLRSTFFRSSCRLRWTLELMPRLECRGCFSRTPTCCSTSPFWSNRSKNWSWKQPAGWHPVSPVFFSNNPPFFSLSLISSSAEIGGKSSFLPSSLKLFIIFSLHLLHVVTPPTLIKSWHLINYPVAALSEESPLLFPPSGNLLLLLLYMISVTSPLMLHHDNNVLPLFCLPEPMRGCLFHVALRPAEMNPLQSTIHTV